MGGGIEGLLGMLAGGQGGAQGLGTLVERLRQGGLGEEVDSWVSTGANKPVAPERLEQAFGADALSGLAQRFGGDGAQGGGVAAILAALLPQVINGLTPQGRVPQSDAEFGQGGMGGALAQMMGAMAGGQGGGQAQGGGIGAMLGGLMGGGAPAGGQQAGAGMGGLLEALMGGGGGGAAPAGKPGLGGGAPIGKPGLGGDGGGALPQKPRPLR
jgi:uncharacterized protein YidB (DUF937 family)